MKLENHHNHFFKFQIQNLSFKFKNKNLFTNISCTFLPNNVFFIKGINGSGKTTFLRLIAGLEKVLPFSGLFLWDLKFVKNVANIQNHKNRLSYLNTRTNLNKFLTVYETLILWGKIYNTEGFLLPIVLQLKLSSLLHQKIHVLSFGQLRLVQFALVILKGVPIWILDEPLLGLDKIKVALVEQIINFHQFEGGIIFIASHTKISLIEKPNLLVV